MSPRLARIAAWMLALALVATPIVAALNGWLANERWPIRRMKVYGSFVQVDEEAVRAAVAPAARAGFFAVDLAEVKSAVEALPWVARAEVRKLWPDRIDIDVRERVALAFWGDDRLLGERGEVFAADRSRVPADLPRLEGPDLRAAEIWQQFTLAREGLAQIGIAIGSARVNGRGAWSLRAVDGAEFVLGREQTRPRLDRFIAALARLPASERSRIERADLRFANGFAVVWRAPPVAPAEPGSGPAAVPAADDATRSLHEPQV
ncbi:MAG: FtsQ-type POTRA domain-containing protein [Xanthomonadales bacterium]|nr:FtsQ-type POTRA domain-containing protein [Xanthomonadales bacterium]MCC6561177.1 FtsQ-type POTRA domain-containing protein [Xanthomonadales bacterium]